MNFEAELRDELNRLKSEHLLRTLTQPNGIDFSSNDYLGLSNNKSSLYAGMEAVKAYGTGSTGSRLLSGNKPIFETFEQQIAQDKLSESALIFNSGYIANASVISAFLELKYQLFFDKLNHASMYPSDARKIGPYLFRYPHLHYKILETMLEKHKDYPKKLIASETIFGMDGDQADIEKLSALAEKYDALLYLDEAHATGLYGPQGYGLSTQVKLNSQTTFIMGTFSKALASSGSYVACPQLFKSYLIQKSKGFIYSTALSPFCIGVAQYNWNQLPMMDAVRQHIFSLSDYLEHQLSEQGFSHVSKGTHIVSIIFDSIEKMLSVHQKLLDHPIITSAVRPPTSPTPRLRIAINALNTHEDVEQLLKILCESK